MVRPLVQKTKKTENLYRHTIYSLYCYIEINFFEHINKHWKQLKATLLKSF